MSTITIQIIRELIKCCRPSLQNEDNKTYNEKFKYLEVCYSSVYLHKYSPKRKYRHPYYINTIEIELLWANIIYLKSHAMALYFCLQTNS